jgi:endoglucanase
MNPKEFAQIASRLVRIPTAPYHEHAVRAEAEKLCLEHGLKTECDEFGNLIVRLVTRADVRPLAFAAHLDHPGFEILRPVSKHSWLVRFRGGVGDDYFRPGIPLRLMPGSVPARLGQCKDKKQKHFLVHPSKSPAVPPRFAVWELEDFAIRNHRLHARACDDLVGVAAVLATLIELKRNRARVNVLGVLSRAEEVGFNGALALAAHSSVSRTGSQTRPLLPTESLVISLETSRELPGAKMGQGVILRVGDKASIFDSAATRFLAEVAGDLKAKEKSFQFQRALMSGGTCEATAYQEYGFQSAAVCVALGNYHNCGKGNRIRAEYVSLADSCHMVDLLAAASRQMPRYEPLVDRLRVRLRKLLRQAQPALRKSARPD